LEGNDDYSMNERNRLAGNIASVRAHYALVNGELNRVIKHAKLALRLLQDDPYARGTAAIALGGAYWGLGDAANAEKAFLDCSTYALVGGYHMRASSALCYAGMQQVKRGNLLAAERTFTQSLDLAQGPRGMRYPNAGFPMVKLGELFCERNQLEQAAQYIHEGVALCEELGHVDLIAEAYAALAKIQFAQADVEGLKETLGNADRLARNTALDPWAVTWLDHSRVRLWLSIGALEKALNWTRKNGPSIEEPFSYHQDLHHAILARVLIFEAEQRPARGGLGQAIVLLSKLIQAAENAGWIHEKIQFLVLQALAYETGGREEEAFATLAEALHLAEPSGYMRVFINEGARLKKLLGCLQPKFGEDHLKGYTFSTGYVTKIISAFPAENQHAFQEKYPDIPDPLTPREMEVLSLLDTSLTTPEIAAKLVVSANTVRSHVKHIYNKLDVRRRLDAVRKAKALNII
jgi:LuxR family maltose regulon positive regulatory protein